MKNLLFASALAASLPTANVIAQASAPKFRVIAFYSTKDVTPNQGYLGRDDAHISYAHESNAFWPKYGAENGFTYDSTKNWDLVGDSAFMSKYDVMLWLDDQPGTATQQANVRKYMARGGALIAFHVCAYDDASMTPNWNWYFDTLLATGKFKNNTWWPTAAKMHIEDTAHPITQGTPVLYTSPVSEWYSFTNDIRKNANIHILWSIDPSAFPVGTDPSQSWTSGYYPIAWTNTKYHFFYCNAGHNYMDYNKGVALSQTWTNATHVKLIYNAMAWLASLSNPSAVKPYARAAAQVSPDLHIDFNHSGFTVTRPGLSDFGVSILDLQGNRISEGRASNGAYTSRADLGRGLYILRSTSAQGNAAKTLSILR